MARLDLQIDEQRKKELIEIAKFNNISISKQIESMIKADYIKLKLLLIDKEIQKE